MTGPLDRFDPAESGRRSTAVAGRPGRCAPRGPRARNSGERRRDDPTDRGLRRSGDGGHRPRAGASRRDPSRFRGPRRPSGCVPACRPRRLADRDEWRAPCRGSRSGARVRAPRRRRCGISHDVRGDRCRWTASNGAQSAADDRARTDRPADCRTATDGDAADALVHPRADRNGRTDRDPGGDRRPHRDCAANPDAASDCDSEDDR